MTADALQITTQSAEHTQALGRCIGELLNGEEVIALIGPLGAGKTQLVKGIVAGAGRADPASVTSPTFTLVNEYPGRPHLFHIDAYRLTGGGELAALGFDEMASPDSSVMIEWADRVAVVLPEDLLTIRIDPTGQTNRNVALQAAGPVARRLLVGIQSHVGGTKQSD